MHACNIHFSLTWYAKIIFVLSREGRVIIGFTLASRHGIGLNFPMQ